MQEAGKVLGWAWACLVMKGLPFETANRGLKGVVPARMPMARAV